MLYFAFAVLLVAFSLASPWFLSIEDANVMACVGHSGMHALQLSSHFAASTRNTPP